MPRFFYKTKKIKKIVLFCFMFLLFFATIVLIGGLNVFADY